MKLVGMSTYFTAQSIICTTAVCIQ